jgi:hypothetical protein
MMMRLDVDRHGLKITPDSSGFGPRDERDLAFIEEVLGLKNDGDSVLLVRKNAMGLSCIAYLETKTKKEK